MGCGSSSAAKGRENYSTLLADQENTPLFSRNEEVAPRLDSFIVPQTPEEEEEKEVSRKQQKFPSLSPSKAKKNVDTKSDENGASFSDIAAETSQKPFQGSFRDLAKETTKAPSHIPSFASNQFEDEEEESSNSFFPTESLPSNLFEVKQEFPSKPSLVSKESLAPPSIAGSEATESLNPPSVLPDPDSIDRSPDLPETKVDKVLALADKEEKPKKSKKKKKRKSEKKDKSNIKMASIPSLEKPLPGSESGMRFDELYRLKGVLGTGAFSTVREGHHKATGNQSFAIKCVNRKKLSEEDESALLDEVSILQEMKHAHIIRLFDFFVEQSTYYLVMERMSGGELFDRIVAKAYYNEKEARDVCKILLEAVGHCHQNNVAHRDLKPENLLLLSEDDDSAVKIADFGFAKKVAAPQSLTTQCGTPGYVAPEILEGIPYDTRADMWSVGVILYILLGGYPPFIENNQRDLFRKIRRGEYEFHEEYWGTVSNEAKNLIASLLTVDCAKRLDAAQALQNVWICGDDAALAGKDLGKNLKALTAFNAKRKFKAAVSAVVAANKLHVLGKEFMKDAS